MWHNVWLVIMAPSPLHTYCVLGRCTTWTGLFSSGQYSLAWLNFQLTKHKLRRKVVDLPKVTHLCRVPKQKRTGWSLDSELAPKGTRVTGLMPRMEVWPYGRLIGVRYSGTLSSSQVLSCS